MAVVDAQTLSGLVDKAVKGVSDGSGNALAALQEVAQLKVNTRLLLDTQAGKQVKRLGKSSDSAISQAAASLVERWKEIIKTEADAGGPVVNGVAKVMVASPSVTLGTKRSADALTPEQKRHRAPPEVVAQRRQAVADAFGSQELASQSDSQVNGQQPLSPRPSASSATSAPIPAKSGNSARDKTRQLLAEALHLASHEVEGGDAAASAVEVENAIFAQNGGINAKYKAKVRSLSFNLKDANNPDLRRRVLNTEISGKELVNMRADELGSDARKEDNQKIREHASKEAERGQHMRKATTDQFQCGKCRERKCTYYQMQTRSADEPMTTFVTCVNCGNRWKFC